MTVHVVRLTSATLRRAAAFALGVAVAMLPAGAERVARAQQADQGAITADGVIRGRVLTSTAGAPLRGAEVRARHINGRDTRLATTDDLGQFELQDLPSGEWTVTAAKAGYVPQEAGQVYPLDASTPLKLSSGQRVALEMRLMRASAIAGRVLNEHGEPIGDVEVRVLRARTASGTRQLIATGMPDVTNDLGSYRVYGLVPGDYFIAVNLPSAADASGGERTTFFPGTTRLADAEAIRVKAGEDQLSVDITAPTPAAGVTISGIVVGPNGPVANTELRLLDPDPVILLTLRSVFARTDGDGRFRFKQVMPGPYVLEAGYGRGGIDFVETALTPLDVGTTDVTGLTLSLVRRPLVTLNVSIVDESGRPLPRDLEVRLRAAGIGPGADSNLVSLQSGGVDRFGPFRIAGRNTFEVSVVNPGWMLKRLEIDGREVTDMIVDVSTSGTTATGRIVLTDRVAEVNGTVALGGSPRAHVVVFADDQARWTYPSRFLKATRTDAEGRFSITGLPDGRYRAVAVNYLEADEFQDPAFLEQVRKLGTEIRLVEGESRTIKLPLTRR